MMLVQFWPGINYAVVNRPMANYQVACAAGKLLGRGEPLGSTTLPIRWHSEAAMRRVGQRRALALLLRIDAFCALVAVRLFGPFANQAQSHRALSGYSVQPETECIGQTETSSHLSGSTLFLHKSAYWIRLRGTAATGTCSLCEGGR